MHACAHYFNEISLRGTRLLRTLAGLHRDSRVGVARERAQLRDVRHDYMNAVVSIGSYTLAFYRISTS